MEMMRHLRLRDSMGDWSRRARRKHLREINALHMHNSLRIWRYGSGARWGTPVRSSSPATAHSPAAAEEHQPPLMQAFPWSYGGSTATRSPQHRIASTCRRTLRPSSQSPGLLWASEFRLQCRVGHPPHTHSQHLCAVNASGRGGCLLH